MKQSIYIIIYIFILIYLLNDLEIYENTFYKEIYTIYKPTSIDVLVNKNNKLDKNYIPTDLKLIDKEYAYDNKYLRKEACNAFIYMVKDAKKQGYNIIAVSTYRSYEYQENLYNNYVKDKGLWYADRCSARAGHSEHQTGLAVDVADLTGDYDNFQNTKEFEWMINNSYKYGFILRYPKSRYHITGFKYEPWHYRYVGVDIATYLFNNKLTLEEYKKKNI